MGESGLPRPASAIATGSRDLRLARRGFTEEILFQESRATMTLARASGRSLPPLLLQETGSQISGSLEGRPRFLVFDGAARHDAARQDGALDAVPATPSAPLMEEAQQWTGVLADAMRRWEDEIARSGIHVVDAAIETKLALSAIQVARREPGGAGSWIPAAPRRAASLEARLSMTVEREGRFRTLESACWAPVSSGPGSDPFASRPDLAADAIARCGEMLDALPPPTMEAPVLFTPAAAGVLLHEICGHLLEGDLIAQRVSPFAVSPGTRVAPSGVTLLDDPLLEGARVHLPSDDEAEASGAHLLIDDGVLRGFLSDRATAAITGGRSTGNGRRETYRHPSLPRMTNLVMGAGREEPGSLLKRIGRGLLVEKLGRGRVDPRRGQFRLEVECGRLIEDGSAGRPVTGAFLIGSCRELLLSIDGVGSDLEVDAGAGVCIKEDQIVPVGSASPSVYVSRLRVLPGAVP